MRKPFIILPFLIGCQLTSFADYIAVGIGGQPINLFIGPDNKGIAGSAHSHIAYETDVQMGNVVIQISFSPSHNWAFGDKLEFSGTDGIITAIIYDPVDGAKSDVIVVDEPIAFDTKFYNTTYTYTCTNRYREPAVLTGTVTFTATTN